MKKKAIPSIVSAIIFLTGCIFAVVGAFKNSGYGYGNLPETDLFDISDEDVGTDFRGSLYAEESSIFALSDTKNGTLYAIAVPQDHTDEIGKELVFAFDVPKSSDRDFSDAAKSSDYVEVSFRGTVRPCDETVSNKLSDLIIEVDAQTKTVYENLGMEYPENNLEEMLKKISPYYIEVAETEGAQICFIIGFSLMAAGVIVLLCALFGKKFLLIFLGVTIVLVSIPIVMFFGKIRTMSSIQEVSDGLYKMNCQYDYKCDEYLNANISTIDGFTEWIIDKHFFGMDIEFDAGNYGCSAFSAVTPESQHLFGRNFDYEETDTLLFYTEPKDGYASYGVTDLKFFGVGTGGIDGNSLAAKGIMLAAPYVTMDGINEAGVGVGILQLDIPELHQDNGKSDLLVFAAIRGILDKCATVDEAIAFLENYDIHSFLDRSYHLFITDKTGKSVVVEWAKATTAENEEILIVEENACTNFVMSQSEFYNPDSNCERYDTIKSRLAEKSGVLTPAEAMTLASDASMTEEFFSTQWSCVYNLDEFTVDICLDRNYDTKHTFTKDDFR